MITTKTLMYDKWKSTRQADGAQSDLVDVSSFMMVGVVDQIDRWKLEISRKIGLEVL